MKATLRYFVLLLSFVVIGCDRSPEIDADESGGTWIEDAVFYQIFPERFANGDASNDPTRETLEFGYGEVPDSWSVSSWTGDWYQRADWEKEMGDSFYHNGVYHRRYGGDLQGVLEKLPYLEDLGINTIYFNPVFYARSLHKYDGNSYHHIDPQFGPDPAGDFELMSTETSDPSTWHWTAADRLFLELLEGAKNRGIRIVIDGVWNHIGRDFFAFRDLVENQESSDYKDWFIVEAFDDRSTPENEFKYQGWWGVESLPEFADTADETTLHPGPKKYIYDSTRRWMDPNGDGDPSDGIAGWRLDVVPDMPIGFWKEWNAFARSINPEVYTTSEVWFDAVDIIVNGGFSSTMNYYAFAFPVKGFLIDGSITATEFDTMLRERREAYPETIDVRSLLNLMDSHDTPRLSTTIQNRSQEYEQAGKFDYDVMVDPRVNPDYKLVKPDEIDFRMQRMVALFQMSYIGAPMVYYGTEAGMWGADDPDDRMPMVWPELEYKSQSYLPDGSRTEEHSVAFDSSLYSFYRDAIAFRRQDSALRSKEMSAVLIDDEQQTIVFSRTNDDRTTLVGLNRNEVASTVTLSAPESWHGLSLDDFIILESSTGSSLTFQDSTLTLRIEPLTGIAFHPDYSE